MTPAKEQTRTPYDKEIAQLEESSLFSHVEWLSRSILQAKREGYLAHGAEKHCGNDGCACCREGIERGLDQAAEGKTGARP